ncbi:hypothetical protein EPUL_005455 [Erysiphe pulchra]|uniref:Uncharacterized protein n=1 Tax=Erysiphe pulchra TaxID=225359 RepID=A0A2S4PMG7_9PEZI|nr:hypothetical protein EPUL_005455 [Erysiphe pulchra]
MIDSMEISQEIQAPSTEVSNHPPPIPPVPLIHNPPPLIAPPPPPSNLTPTTKAADCRLILRPVAPSKRPIPERPQNNSRNNSDIVNAYLSQEPAENIATRQRHERAWYARIMICTTVISSIDSTLAIFTKEVEKEEIVAFEAYLSLAIANFAATDSSPPPPRVPLHSRLNKGSGNESSKGKRKEKNLSKIAAATPRIAPNQNPNLRIGKDIDPPRIFKDNDKSWAVVARNGQKKARVVQNNNIMHKLFRHHRKNLVLQPKIPIAFGSSEGKSSFVAETEDSQADDESSDTTDSEDIMSDTEDSEAESLK